MAKRTIANFDIRLTASSAELRGDFARAGQAASGYRGRINALSERLATFSTAAAIGGVVALGAAMVRGARSALDFQTALTNSLAIMGDVSQAQKDQMTAVAQDVASETKFSAKDAAEAYFFLASAGLDAAQSMAAMPAVAKFAQAGNFDLARATDLATDAQSALGLTVADSAENLANMTRVTDVLIRANTLANATAEQFSVALTNKAGPGLRQLNKDIEEGVAVLAAFADQGLKDAEAGTALGIILRDLTTKGLEFREAFAAAGISVFDESGNMQNIADVIGDIENALAGLSDAASKQLLLDLGFSDKSLGFLLTLVGTSDKIRNYERELRSAAGTTEEVAAKQMTPFAVAINKISAAFEAFSIDAFSEPLAAAGEVIVGMLSGVDGRVDSLATDTRDLLLEFVESFRLAGPAIQEFFLTSIDQAAAFVQILGDVLGWINGVIAGIENFASYAATIGRAVGTAFNPFSLLRRETGAITDAADELQRMSDAIESVGDPTRLADVTGQFEAMGFAALGVADAVNSITITDPTPEIDASRLQELAALGERLREQFASPEDRLTDQIDELREAFAAGVIDTEIFNAAAGSALDAFADNITVARGRGFETLGVGAFEAGSTAAFSAVQSAMRRGLDERDLAQQQLAEQRRMAKALDELNKKAGPPVAVTTVKSP